MNARTERTNAPISLRPGTMVAFRGGSGYVRVVLSYRFGNVTLYGYMSWAGRYGCFVYSNITMDDIEVLVVPR